jgi:hypothetical protein
MGPGKLRVYIGSDCNNGQCDFKFGKAINEDFWMVVMGEVKSW